MAKNYNYSTILKDDKLFFSLVDYRNNYFISDNPDKIIQFYDGFNSREQLIAWMKDRPKGNYKIQEISGNKDIIVVIPTIDVDGKFAKNCRENIFTGLHLIFVESGYDNFYFNYAYNCNAGIKRAMEYNPKWLIISNDDMYKVDDIDNLMAFLKGLNPDKVGTIYGADNEKLSTDSALIFMGRIFRISSMFRDISFTGIKYYHTIKKRQILLKKFDCKLITIINKKILSIFLKPKDTFYIGQALNIFSRNFILKMNNIIFDDTYINAYEDADISYIIFKHKINAIHSNFRIAGVNGSSLGSYNVKKMSLIGFKTNKQNISSGLNREIRDIAGVVYFNYKLTNSKELQT